MLAHRGSWGEWPVFILSGYNGVEAELKDFAIFVTKCNTQFLLVSNFLEHICDLLLAGLGLFNILLLALVLKELQDECHNLLKHLLLLLRFHQLAQEVVVNGPLFLVLRA